MTMSIEITPDLEQQLTQAAAQAGLTPSAYIIQTLRERLAFTAAPPTPPQRLTAVETQLLLQVNQSLAHIAWERYHTLMKKRHAETLRPAEQEELISLADQIEAANVVRMTYVAELARVRHTTLEAIMRDFALKPIAHA